MRYPIAIKPGMGTSAFGVVIPDLPGCFSAGDSLDEGLAGAEEAIAAWIDAMLDAGEAVPAPTALDALRQILIMRGGRSPSLHTHKRRIGDLLARFVHQPAPVSRKLAEIGVVLEDAAADDGLRAV